LLLLPTLAHAAGGQPGVRETRVALPQAIQFALENNLDLDVARTGPLVANEGVQQARGVYDPVGFAEYRFDSAEDPSANSVQDVFGGGNVTQVNSNQWSYTAGVGGQLPFGLSYSTSYNMTRVDSDSGFFVLEPQNQATATSEITLPLLRDFLYNEASVTVKRSRIAKQISEEDFRAALTDIILGVELAYWGLAASRENVRVAEKSLETTQDLLEQTEVRHEVGVVSRVLVTQAEAGVADREFQLIVARNLAGTAQDQLLNAIAAPDPASYRLTQLIPENPAYFEYEIDEEIAISKALRLRPELAASRRRLEDAQVQLSFAKNQRLPRLDVTGGYSMSGISGTQKSRTGSPAPGGGTVPDLGFDRGWHHANDDFFNSPGNSWSVGARFEIPFGNRTRKHTVFQRDIELRRAASQLRRTEQVVILDVRAAVRDLNSAIEGLEAAERRRIAQEETLRAEQERLRLGDSTPFQVLEFEEDLADAERQQIGALQTYRNAVVEIEQAQGTLPSARGISVEEEIDR
jgi:outer membrane protein TolC